MLAFLPCKPKSGRLTSFLLLTALAATAMPALAADRIAEQVTLKNGFELICDHREQDGNRMRLYTEPGTSNFVEVGASEVVSIEAVTLHSPVDATVGPLIHPSPAKTEVRADLTKAELHEMLATAGAQHNLDENLLASVVRAESGGHTRASSRTGAQGLMQLMPKTAAQLGVNDSFLPEENIAGGTAYLDALLTRYHDNLALALAAYNAGPGAVDRWHGVPPYRETRLYIARIIRDFNASVRAVHAKSSLASATTSASLLSGAVAP
ncbi:Soluble lytic murein transglycosylase precursor [Acidisarcina polymorpha]|uniref:Soluble lytic murein transglycosylase n=1 Tax=Acidisarcina polymorpha TaxID=2211140 RepID=A0A2Z5FUU4_9BACT|nr:lytic transglycosylase domain-containing protein [Acidisarcina polymorpha]AXC10520.1 Soluble lytic murein transglycosylase precursor [Acidisarcina polymorpha]